MDISRFRAMETEFYNLTVDCIDRWANSKSHQNKVALISVRTNFQNQFEKEIFTFRDLQNRIDQFASFLHDSQISHDEKLIIRLPNSVEFPISFLGAIKAGVIPIPTSPFLTVEELKFILNDSEASVLVTMKELLPEEFDEKAFPSLKKIVKLSAISTSPFSPPYKGGDRGRSNFSQAVFPTSPAYWLYTSGTEGKPKAVIHSHQSIPAHDLRVKYWQDLQENDVVFNTSSLNWSYALTAGLLDVWRHGATSLIYEGNLTAENIFSILEENQVIHLMSVPTLYRRMVEYLESSPHPAPLPQGERGKRKLRVCLSAGEKLPEEIRERFQKLTGITIREGLGMTEQSVYLVQRFDEPIVPNSCGKPLNDQVKILREDLSETDPLEVGVIASHHSSPGLMVGYYHRPEEEKKVFQKDWFLSGDFAYRDEENNFFFVGRKDDLITAGGFRISPLEVERVLNSHPSVVESAVVGKEIEAGKTIVVGFVVLNPPNPPLSKGGFLKKDILDYTSKNLAKYKVPREIIFVEKLPKTVHGKLKRKELTKM